MPSLPATSPEHYLTGTSAMAIPSPDTPFVDWHFVDTFLEGKASFRVAGTNFPDTTALLGSLGIHECSGILRRHGVPLPPDRGFYAANRDRALLDLIVSNLQQARRPDHLRLVDFCEDEADSRPLRELLQTLRHLLTDPTQRRLLDEWLAQQ
jgi:hypothetical protein